MTNTNTYTKYCILGILSLLIFTAIVNRIVDPFWYYRDISINGFNANKTEFHAYEDHIKPIIIKDIKPEVMIFGNSFSEIGFNPLHPGLTNNGNYRSYNYGIPASNWDKVYCNVLYAIDNTKLKRVIIGIQPDPLPAFDCTQKMYLSGNMEQKTLLLSFDALRATFNTLRRQHKPPSHTINGMSFYHRNYSSQIEQIFRIYFNRYKIYPASKVCKKLDIIQTPTWSFPKNYIDTAGLNYLLNTLISHNIQVKLIVYPSHALWMELLMSCGDISGRWDYLYQIATVVAEVNKTNNIIELWDFQGAANMLTERIRNSKVHYWQDTGHFNFEMGDAMLDVIFNNNKTTSITSSDDFGVLLTPKSVVDRYYNFFSKRNDFILKNPWFLEDFEHFIK